MFQLFVCGLVAASLASAGLGSKDYRTREVASSKLCDMNFFDVCGLSVLSIQSRDDEVVTRCVAEIKRRKNKDHKRQALLLLDLPADEATQLAHDIESNHDEDTWGVAAWLADIARERSMTYCGRTDWLTCFEFAAVWVWDGEDYFSWPYCTLVGCVYDLRYNE